MKVYVASSWRNKRQQLVVRDLRAVGHEVFDYRDPDGTKTYHFHWSEIDPNWETWTAAQFMEALEHPLVRRGYEVDMEALAWCDACVLVQPCGDSSHLELGWATGAGKKTIVLLAHGDPEIMYKMVTHLCISIEEVVEALDGR